MPAMSMMDGRKLAVDDLTEFTEDRKEVSLGGLPSEAELILLCLDYLRDVRRSYSEQDLFVAEGIDADYLSAAIYSLSRSFLRPPHLSVTSQAGNDAWMDRVKVNKAHPGTFPPRDQNSIQLPDLNTINREILYSEFQNDENYPNFTQEDKKDDGEFPVNDANTYQYDDSHDSNSHRFYCLNGLASGPNLDGPLTLGEIAAAGLAGLAARSRFDAERDMIKTPLFEQFVEAVRTKGFFRDPDTEVIRDDPDDELVRQQKAQEVYEDRYRKVVAKFRTKLATKAQHDESNAVGSSQLAGNTLALSAADRQRRRRANRIENARYKTVNMPLTPMSRNVPDDNVTVATSVYNIIDLDQAEKLKSEGNVFMQKKDYKSAADSYTAALKLSPSGPQSHVYFSNRAAALLSMKNFDEAILDSERSLALKPDYGKAHARLGLAHFLLGNYRQAMEAYTVSLKYDPDNKSSKNYLEKAAKRLAKQDSNDDGNDHFRDSSFSVASEWDKSKSLRTQNLDGSDERKALIAKKESEKNKLKGNSYMASRDYKNALDAYSKAIDLLPNGANSHVYFSNRAAALCYLERYEEAEADSQMSLKLDPTYGKAHARLGLSRFFLGDYEGAVAAYTEALKFDPDNAASKSYLAKAKSRLAKGASGKTPRKKSGPGMKALAPLMESK